jgi:uncharacterized integral membrane protein
MRILTWILRIILFLALFLLALKNTDTVSLQLYFDRVWQAPLILVLLVFFAAGAALGVLATLGRLFRQRREIARLQRELGKRPGEASARAPAADGDIDSQSDI